MKKLLIMLIFLTFSLNAHAFYMNTNNLHMWVVVLDHVDELVKDDKAINGFADRERKGWTHEFIMLSNGKILIIYRSPELMAEIRKNQK